MKVRIQMAAFLFTVMTLLLSCSHTLSIPDPLDWKVDEFEGVNVDGKTITLTDLKGKVWITNFGYTHCTKVCPPQTKKIAELQHSLREDNIDVQFVTFTVDPNRDKPEVLKNFIKDRGGDLSNWYALTGYSFDDIKSLSASSFNFPITSPTEGSDQFSHGTSLYLVNQEGVVVKRYDGLSPPNEEIKEHASILLGL